MRKILAVVLAMVICCGLVGCGDEASKKEDRFDVVLEESETAVIVDKDTGVMYLRYKFANAGGLTVMVDADGNPLLYEEGANP